MATRPPRLADWLLHRLLVATKPQALIGDLHEQCARGRSSAWYWRQVIGVIVTSFAADAWRYKSFAAFVIALGVFLPRIYLFIVWPRIVVALDRLWYPHLISSRWSWIVTDPWAYRLQPYLWTGRIVWCALIATTAWMISRWRPSQRGLLLALFGVTQVALSTPGLRFAATTWWHARDNAIWAFDLLWFSSFTFVAIPLSIVLGGVWMPD